MGGACANTTVLGELYYGITAYSIWRDNQSFFNLALQSRSSISNFSGIIFWFLESNMSVFGFWGFFSIQNRKIPLILKQSYV